MSFKIFLDKMEAFHQTYFPKIEQLNELGEEELPIDLKNEITSDSEALLLKFSSYLKQIDNITQQHIDFSFRSKKLAEIQNEKKQNEKNLVQISNNIDNLLEEVKSNMKFINQNVDIKPQKIIDYALKINESLAAPQNFCHTDPDPVKDFFPNDDEKFNSTLQFYHSNKPDDCIHLID